jgi:hypothetical protein
MSTDHDVAKTDGNLGTDAVRMVIASADIKRIVCVDDGFTASGSVDIEAIISAVSSGEVAAELIKSVAQAALGESFESYLADDDDPDAQAQWLREHSDDLTESMWTQLGGNAPEEPARSVNARDYATLQSLQDFSADVGLEFIGLDLSAWRSREEELLQQDGCSLIFFDRNMSKDGGAADEGESLLQTTVKQYPPEKVVAVLFTHSVNIQDEFSAWQTLADSNPGYRDRVLVIAKQRLEGAGADFASELKMAILAPRLQRVAERIKQGFADQAAAAAERLVALSPHVLHTILVTTVAKEGSWGPDGLTAIASMYLRRGVEAYVRSDVEVGADAARLQEISLKSPDVQLPGGAAEEYMALNRDRLFDDGSHINELRLPIDTGDIFAFFNPASNQEDQGFSQLWIIVVQRCDLAVRNDGTRNYKPPLLPLARISKPSDRGRSGVGAGGIARSTLMASPIDGNAACEINLSERKFVPYVALDACALNSDGVGRLEVAVDPVLAGLTPSWAVLARHHFEWGRKKLDLYKAASSGLSRNDASANKALISSMSGASKEVNGFGATMNVESRTILFGIRRVARLREPYAQDLMERMGALASRIPLEAAIQPDESDS